MEIGLGVFGRKKRSEKSMDLDLAVLTFFTLVYPLIFLFFSIMIDCVLEWKDDMVQLQTSKKKNWVERLVTA